MDLTKVKIPNHVAIILDGNGRWAKERGLSRSKGHDAGFDNLKKISKYIFSCGVKVLSLYCFSTENFKRSDDEVNHLMNIFAKLFRKEIKILDILKLSIKYKKGIFCIETSNSHNNMIKKNNKLLATTKLNSDLHGYGLKNTERIVEKYHGSLEYKYDNHMFFTTVIMFI